jgi:hypothetical protein
MDQYVNITSKPDKSFSKPDRSLSRPDRSYNKHTHASRNHSHQNHYKSSNIVEINNLDDIDIESDEDYELDKIKSQSRQDRDRDLNIIKEHDAPMHNSYIPKQKQKMVSGVDYGLDLLTNKNKQDTSDFGSSYSQRRSSKNQRHHRQLISDAEDSLNEHRPGYSLHHEPKRPPMSSHRPSNHRPQHGHSHRPQQSHKMPNMLEEDDEFPDDYESEYPDENDHELESEYLDEDELDDDDELDENDPNFPSKPKHQRRKTYDEIVKEKQKYLIKIERLRKLGYESSRKLVMSNSLEEIRAECERLEDEKGLDSSIKFQQKVLMGVATGVEWLNNQYDPFGIILDGWSESMYENLNEYDEVFEELYEKYKDQVALAPEIKLLMMVVGSAMMFHVSKTLFSTETNVPHFKEIMNDNPELKKAYQDAAIRHLGHRNTNYPGNVVPNAPGLNNVQGGTGGNNPFGQMLNGLGTSPAINNMLNMFMGGGNNNPRQPKPVMGQARMNPPQMNPGNSQVQMPPPGPVNQRVEMDGPDDVDDLLNELHNPRNDRELGLSDYDNSSEGSTLSQQVNEIKNIKLRRTKKGMR